MFGLSVIVTYFMGEQHIFKCLDSLIDSYGKSKKELSYEIIVVIDSMQDAEQIEFFLNAKYKFQRVHIKRNEKNIGVAKSRNHGLAFSKYKFFTIIDQDDYVNENYFSVLERELKTQYPVYFLNGTINHIEFDIEVPIYTFTPRFTLKSLILKQSLIYTPGLLVFNEQFVSKESLFIDTSDQYKGCDDWAAYLGILKKSGGSIEYKFVKDLLFVYCLHGRNYSNNKEEMIRSSYAVLDHIDGEGLTANQTKYVNGARRMLRFEFAKEVRKLPAVRLFSKYPAQFINHYIISFFNRDRLNRILFQGRFQLIAKTKTFN
jgi:glycosyltransferase involved in cell wall biosynthesis